MLTPPLILVARKREAGARVIALGTSLGGVHKVKQGRRLSGRTYDEMPAL